MTQGIEALDKYVEYVKENRQECLEDYLILKNSIEKSPIKHNGATIGFIYNPLFYLREEIITIEKIMLKLVEILEKVIKEYLLNSQFRRAFNFSQELEKLILLDPGYEMYFPMARFDIFYDFENKELKFCELNTDGSSGMTKSLVLDREFIKSKPILTMQKQYKISYLDPVDTWIKALLENYAGFSGNFFEKPNIAIIDLNWSKQGMVTEFQEFQRRLEELGYPTIICDPRDLKFHNGKLYYKNIVINLIYRRAVTSDLLKIYSEIPDLILALKEKAVCMVGSFRSQIIHNKQIFAVIHDPLFTDFFNAEEKAFIKKYIPYTAIYEEGHRQEVLAGRKHWVLKPLDAYQSRGVYIGRDYTDDEWQEIVGKIKPQEYLFQEFIEVPRLALVNYVEGRLVEEKYNQMIGLFLYNKKFSGFYTRVSPFNNVASGLGAVTIPNFIIEDR